MKKSLLLLFLMAAAFMGGVIPVFAEATIVTNKATLNRIARIGSTGNYLTSAFLQNEAWYNADGETKEGYVNFLKFSLADVKSVVNGGKLIKSAKIRITHHGNGTSPQVDVRGAANDWDENVTKEDLIDKARVAVENELITNAAPVFANSMVSDATADPMDMKDMANYQGYIDITGYVKSQLSADELSLIMHRPYTCTGSTGKSQFWSVNASATNRGTTQYTADIWAAMLEAFGMTEEEFITAVSPTLIVELEDASNSAVDVSLAQADCYVRTNAANNSYNTEQVEMWNNSTSQSYGLFAFNVPEAVTYKDLVTVTNAKLRLVTRKTNNNNSRAMAVYVYGNDFAENATYNGEASNVAAALATPVIASFDAKGQAAKAMTDTGLGADNQVLSAWTNEVDLTDYVNNTLTSTRMNLMLFHANDPDVGTQFYSRSVTDKNLNGVTPIPAADLVPRLTVNYTVSYRLTVSAAKAATLCLPFDALIPAGVTAYTLSYTSGSAATATEVTNYIPANIPVLINAEAGDYTFDAATTGIDKSAAAVKDALTGVYTTTVVPAGAYILTNGASGVGFRKVDGTTNYVDPYRAYLTAEGSGAKFLTISFGSATGIDAVAGKAMENGAVYSLQGVKVDAGNLKDGVYIKNGKKVIISNKQ